MPRLERWVNKFTGKPYEYTEIPRPHGKDYIRYLVLEPGKSKDPLSCSLVAAPLDETPQFEAISYVWGDAIFDQKIICDPEKGTILHITPTLRDALRQVRLTDKPRAVWADSICINQQDKDEKSYQVGLMGKIYSQSRCTLICLGPNDESHANKVATLLAEIDTMMQKVFDDPGFSWDWNSFPQISADDLLLSDERWRSYQVLLEQRWFGRGWTVQEAALGQDVSVLWGNQNFKWMSVLRAYNLLLGRSTNTYPLTDIIMSRLHFEGYREKMPHEAKTLVTPARMPEGGMSLIETLDRARSLGLTEPRDRIYAFLGLPVAQKTLSVSSLRPDYNRSTVEVYQDFAEASIQATSSLHILTYVEHYDSKSVMDSTVGSWVPRWNVQLLSTQWSYPNWREICPERQHYLTPPVNNVLRVRGVLFGSVSFVTEEIDHTRLSMDGVTKLWNQVFQASQDNPSRQLYTCPLNEAFAKTYSMNIVQGSHWSQRRAAWMRHLRINDDETPGGDPGANGQKLEDTADEDVKTVHQQFVAPSHRRSFMVLDGGHYGLAPGIAMEGDICAVIFGTQSPFILRKTDEDNHYKLVGGAWVLSKHTLEGYGHIRMSIDPDYDDWLEVGAEEQDIYIC